MMHVLESWESLAHSLNVRDRLENSRQPLEVISVIAEAVQRIGAGWEEREHHLTELRQQLQITDRLEDILARVKSLYSAVCIPRDYRQWWKEAQEGLEERIQWYTDAITQLQSMPCATARQRRKVRETQFADTWAMAYSAIMARGEDPDAVINDVTVFNRWKNEREQWMLGQIDATQRLRQRLIQNVPTLSQSK